MEKFGIFKLAAFAIFLAAMVLPRVSVAADGSVQQAAGPGAKQRVIFQVSDNDPRKWNLALNNVQNVQDDVGRDNVEVELVAYGPGLAMLKLESEVSTRIADALDKGVNIVACENTMTNTKTTRADMLPKLGYVKAGVVELMEKQRAGWAYIRP